MPKILDRIDGPGDVKRLSPGELEELCSELRESLVGRVSENGGHLASNLGAVELTVALHRVFEMDVDEGTLASFYGTEFVVILAGDGNNAEESDD